MQIRDILNEIEAFAPLRYQESYDNSGLQVGDDTQEVRGVLLCIDITEQVLDEAIEKGCNLIIAHHPLLFRGIKKITPTDATARCIIKAVQNQITLYASHTNMDKAPHGVSFKTAQKLGIQAERPLVPEAADPTFGLGIIGTLPQAEDAHVFLLRAKRTLQLGALRHSDIPNGKKVRRIALCGGSAFEFYTNAAREGADLYLTADVKYHQFFEATGSTILADIGHFESEQFTKDIFYEILSKINANFAVIFSDRKTNPINYI